MPFRIDDPELLAKVESLKAVGYAFNGQEDLRLRWLELALARLEAKIETLERVERQVEGEQPGLEA
jgi:hypothetical protein